MMPTIEQSLGNGRDLREDGAGQARSVDGLGPVLTAGYDVHEIWYRLLPLRPWSSLAVVSPERTPRTLLLARSLAELGTQLGRGPIEIVDGTQVDLERANSIARLVEPARGLTPVKPRFVVALDSPIASPLAIAVVAATDAVLLLLERGVSGIPQARRIVEMVGRERVIGAVFDVG
ncbi:MAG TPA: hypothetical protein VE964_14560 [Myxococcales bacterium]|nr:hypothetical protein [Myxococcales bacterium]